MFVDQGIKFKIAKGCHILSHTPPVRVLYPHHIERASYSWTWWPKQTQQGHRACSCPVYLLLLLSRQSKTPFQIVVPKAFFGQTSSICVSRECSMATGCCAMSRWGGALIGSPKKISGICPTSAKMSRSRPIPSCPVPSPSVGKNWGLGLGNWYLGPGNSSGAKHSISGLMSRGWFSGDLNHTLNNVWWWKITCTGIKRQNVWTQFWKYSICLFLVVFDFFIHFWAVVYEQSVKK